MNYFLKISRFAALILISCIAFTLTSYGQKDKHKKKKKAVVKTEVKSKAKAVLPSIKIADEDESMSGHLEWRLILKDDNFNVSLPVRYRTWWYVKLEGVDTNKISTLTIEGDGFPGKTVVLPVYSYDRKEWFRFHTDDVTSLGEEEGMYDYYISLKFAKPTVWVARYYPYPMLRLTQLLKKYEKNPFLKVEEIGTSTQGRPIQMITITNPAFSDENKKRVWIHARTHPSETASSFVVEGLIEMLLSECCNSCKKVDLSKLIFNIVPILNPDGVALGNARVTPDSSYDLERMWYRSGNNPRELLETVPSEISAVHSTILRLREEGPDFIAAINLHSKNAFPDWRPFLYTNFRQENKETGVKGDSMFISHLSFAKLISRFYCGDTVNVRSSFEIGIPMERKLFPESWWWINFENNVLAVTLETVTGSNGCFEDWKSTMDQFNLGEALGQAIQKYFEYYIEKKWVKYDAPCTNKSELMKFYIGGDGDDKTR